MKRKRIDTLAFFTSSELIEELVHRETFVGIVIASKDEHKKHEQIHADFVTYSAIGKGNLISILERITKTLKN